MCLFFSFSLPPWGRTSGWRVRLRWLRLGSQLLLFTPSLQPILEDVLFKILRPSVSNISMLIRERPWKVYSLVFSSGTNVAYAIFKIIRTYIEKIRHTLRGSISKYERVWQPFLRHIKPYSFSLRPLPVQPRPIGPRWSIYLFFSNNSTLSLYFLFLYSCFLHFLGAFARI